MAVTLQNRGSGTVPASLTAVFVVTTGATDVIRAAVAFASTTSDLTLHRVPSGVTATGISTQIGLFTLTANQSRVLVELLNQVFGAGDALHASTSVTGAIGMQLGGARVTP